MSCSASPAYACSETVPDKVMDKADDIVIVDLPPEELISG